MKYIKFPFIEKIVLQIKNDSLKREVYCELASSNIEIFQSLCYRNKKEFKLPLVLKFETPIIQSFSLQNFSFPVEQICVDYKANLVRKLAIIYPAKVSGKFVQGYSEFSLVILAPIGFSKSYKLIEDKTLII